MKYAYPTTIYPNIPLPHLIVDVAPPQHGLLLFLPLLPLQPFPGFLFTSPQYSGIFIPVVFAHLKCPFLWLWLFLTTTILTSRIGHFQPFRLAVLKNHAYIRTSFSLIEYSPNLSPIEMARNVMNEHVINNICQTELVIISRS